VQKAKNFATNCIIPAFLKKYAANWVVFSMNHAIWCKFEGGLGVDFFVEAVTCRPQAMEFMVGIGDQTVFVLSNNLHAGTSGRRPLRAR